jgi:hypothetical protein
MFKRSIIVLMSRHKLLDPIYNKYVCKNIVMLSMTSPHSPWLPSCLHIIGKSNLIGPDIILPLA